MQDQIIKEILEMLEQKSYAQPDQTADTDIYEDGGLDSLDILEFLLDVEDHFQIKGLDDEIESIKTVRDIAVKVEARLGHKISWGQK